ncbi:hypothetical protein JNO54_00860 [Janibacter sp. YIM B02568]|uniref:hypothetical protein n=1 Tax=Janibacter endophyticus TaxID=2806261 RepID=UPI00194FA9E7|nr:hypothetical protein [Janibacter endophyticus]MBM6544692.1 hypothetical protein [Janibacter endophyticus]
MSSTRPLSTQASTRPRSRRCSPGPTARSPSTTPGVAMSSRLSSNRASAWAVVAPSGWAWSQVVERSSTPSWAPVVGSWTGAAQHTHEWMIEA